MSDPKEAARIAMDNLQYRLTRIHAATLDGRPKQAFGEMVAAMMNMPEWEIARIPLEAKPVASPEPVPLHPGLPTPTDTFGKPDVIAQWYICGHCKQRSPLRPVAAPQDQDAKDAERYRFMRGNESFKFWSGLAKLKSAEWNEFIDAAMGESHEPMPIL